MKRLVAVLAILLLAPIQAARALPIYAEDEWPPDVIAKVVVLSAVHLTPSQIAETDPLVAMAKADVAAMRAAWTVAAAGPKGDRVRRQQQNAAIARINELIRRINAVLTPAQRTTFRRDIKNNGWGRNGLSKQKPSN